MKPSYDLEAWKRGWDKPIKYEGVSGVAKINSKAKGKGGELEAVHKFKEYGFSEARRSQQYSGEGHTADIVGMRAIHVEVKRVERLNIDDAIDQCHRDKKECELGVVMHRKNNRPWLVTMTYDEWMEMYKRYLVTLE